MPKAQPQDLKFLRSEFRTLKQDELAYKSAFAAAYSLRLDALITTLLVTGRWPVEMHEQARSILRDQVKALDSDELAENLPNYEPEKLHFRYSVLLGYFWSAVRMDLMPLIESRPEHAQQKATSTTWAELYSNLGQGFEFSEDTVIELYTQANFLIDMLVAGKAIEAGLILIGDEALEALDLKNVRSYSGIDKEEAVVSATEFFNRPLTGELKLYQQQLGKAFPDRQAYLG